MKNTLLLSLLIISLGSFSQTPITDANFQQAIDSCLSTNPVDGLCYDCEFGAMPDWDVSAVTDMSKSFEDRNSFNGDISNWDVRNVLYMQHMFANAYNFNQDIGLWNVSSVTNMFNMFISSTSFNQDIGSWDVSNVTNMHAMFANDSGFNQDLSSWDVSNVTNMAYMFNAVYIIQDIGSWNVSNVTDMNGMFASAYEFNQDIGSWDVSSVTDMNGMFATASEFNQDIGSWDVSNVTNMNTMFAQAEDFNQDVSSWCVFQIPTAPDAFSDNSLLLPEFHPQWGKECDTTAYVNDVFLKDKVCIYPNPTEFFLSIEIESEKITEINIYNQFSQRILNTKTYNGKLDISDLKAGVYIIEIITNENSFKQLIIKQ